MNTRSPRPSTTDIEALPFAGLVERDLPGERHRRLQEFIMTEIQRDPRAGRPARRVPRPVLVLAGTAVAAALVAAVAVGTGGVRPSPDGGNTTEIAQTPATRTFELAANHAATVPFTAPRPDQWLYIKNRNLSPSAIAADKGQDPDSIMEVWKSADGKQMAEFNPFLGYVQAWDQDNEYPRLSTLPTNPQALLAALRAETTGESTDPLAPRPEVDTSEDAQNGLLFERIAMILDGNLLPPDVTAALWRAAALVPGVSQADELVEIDGRTVIAVGRIQDGWRFSQLLLDPDTHAYVGFRSVAVKDFTYTGTPNGPVTEKAGTVQVAMTRLAATVVDGPGQTG
jgi:hypothetical protein